MSAISDREEVRSFRSHIAKNKACVGDNHVTWVYYDIGPKNVEPLVMLAGTSGTADLFLYQLLSLGNRGYRVIAAQVPQCYTTLAFVVSMHAFLAHLGLEKIHLFGLSLGGFLACHYVAVHPARVLSLALCNAFADTWPFRQTQGCLKLFRYMPEFALKKVVLDGFPARSDHPEVVDFVVQQVDTLSRQDLASRLTLNCSGEDVPAFKNFPSSKIMLIDSQDAIVLPDGVRDRLYERFTKAKLAPVKRAGDFPVLSCPDDVNMYLLVHLRAHGKPAQASATDDHGLVPHHSGLVAAHNQTGATAHGSRQGAIKTTPVQKSSFFFKSPAAESKPPPPSSSPPFEHAGLEGSSSPRASGPVGESTLTACAGSALEELVEPGGGRTRTGGSMGVVI